MRHSAPLVNEFRRRQEYDCRALCHGRQTVANLNPLKFCFQCRRSVRRATFRTLPGLKRKREVCAECFEKIMANRKEKGSDHS